MIRGRKAIPVRAIPLLTDWARMNPDAVAAALAGDVDHYWQFCGLTACAIEGVEVRFIPNTWWKSYLAPELKALRDRIEDSQISHETGAQDWRRKSLDALPPGVFVWKDEYEPMYFNSVGPRSKIFKLAAGDELPDHDLPEYVNLNFDPFIPDPEIRQLVMEGFAPSPETEVRTDPAGEAWVEPALAEKIDWDLLATPEQLLDAFGGRGLKRSWFADLNSHSWLKAARKVVGKGQRGSVIKPLFCPLAVINGLMNNIRGSKRLEPDKGWAILEHKFPKVFTAYECGDTRGPPG